MGNGKSRDEMSVMDIYKRLSEARMQLWLIFDDDRAVSRGHIVAPRGRPAAVQSEPRAHPYTRQGGGRPTGLANSRPSGTLAALR